MSFPRMPLGTVIELCEVQNIFGGTFFLHFLYNQSLTFVSSTLRHDRKPALVRLQPETLWSSLDLWRH